MTDTPAPTTEEYPILVDGYGRQFVKVPVEDFVKMEVKAEVHVTPAEALDVERLPNGARLMLQRGDDFGERINEWFAIVENTIDLPDHDTGRLGVGRTPQAALDDAVTRFLLSPHTTEEPDHD